MKILAAAVCCLRARVPGSTSRPYATIPVGAAAHGEFVVRQPGTVAGMPSSRLHSRIGLLDGRRLRARGARGRRRSRRARRRVDLRHGQYPCVARGGTGFAELDHHDVRRRDGHSRLGRCACGNDIRKVRDSRKTIPGLRMLQKYAVRIGGGLNHRMSLADAALIKDNHVIAAGGVVAAYRAVRESFPDIPIEVEVTSAEQAREVVAAGATEILLDNMSTVAMAGIVAELAGSSHFRGEWRLDNTESNRGCADRRQFRCGRSDHPFRAHFRYCVSTLLLKTEECE